MQETQETWVRSLGQEDPLETAMATHSSILAWEIPWTEESGRLQPLGSQRTGHDCGASLIAQSVKNLPACRRPGFDSWVWKIPWRRKWQPTPVLLPGESHGQRSLAGSSPWGRKEEEQQSNLAHTHSYLKTAQN